MTWDEEVFGREYDLGVFNIVAVRDFNFGAMENKGLNIFNSAYVLADEDTATDADFEAIESIVAHEYFHNWTGNRITCRDWFQLCLKEGLTVYRDQEFSADMRSRPVQRIKDVIRLRARQFAEDAGPLAHAVRPDHYGSIDNLYTATVYEKGAEIIRMLQTMLGQEAFLKGMQIYFDRHDGDAATLEDFYACFEELRGRPLAPFMKWYSQPGTPQLTVEEDWDSASKTFTVTLRQHTDPTPGQDKKEPLEFPLYLALYDENGRDFAENDQYPGGQWIDLMEAAQHTLTFHCPEASASPLLMVNADFSAPIKVHRTLTFEQRLAFARIQDDPYHQWDTFQSLLTDEMLALAYDGRSDVTPALIDALATGIEAAAKYDPAFAALLARLPAIGELMLARIPADPSALGKARGRVRKALAAQLTALTQAILEAPAPAPFKPDAEQAGIRALRGAAMDLLAAQEEDTRLLGLYQSATNMTESLAALRALAQLHGTVARDEAISDFYHRWSDNPLVIDKWFSAQAMSANAEAVLDLLGHADFDLKNPNRVRAVVGVFAAMNLTDFHAPDGSGYRLLADVITKADKLNPALAARLAGTFEQWKTLEPNAAANAKAALETLQGGDLSKNTTDIISRALG